MTRDRFLPPQAHTGPPAQAVVIGASAGALDALSTLLPALPQTFPLPIFVVVHIPADKKSVMAELLKAKSRVDVREADDKEPILGGTVYLAPPDYHLLVESDGRLSLSSDAPVLYSRPSIDVLFESAADVYGDGLIGIILSGANHDGTRGLQAVMAAGGRGLVQLPHLAQSATMPQSALDACPDAISLSLPDIATYLLEVTSRK